MANMKKVMASFEYHQCDDFAGYLGAMAREGWHFKEWKNALIFEEGEPEDAVYDVQVFSKAKNEDYKPEGETMDYADMCESAGWKLIDGKGKFVIFKQMEEDAVPIITEEEKLENVKAASRSRKTQYLLLIFCGIMFPAQVWAFAEDQMFNNLQIFLGLVWFGLLVSTVIKWVRMWKAIGRAEAEYEAGLDLYFGRNRGNAPARAPISQMAAWALAAVYMVLIFILSMNSDGMAFAVIILGIIIMILGLIVLLQAKRPGRGTRKGVIAAFIAAAILIPVITAAVAVSSAPDDLEIYDSKEVSESVIGFMTESVTLEDGTHIYCHYHLKDGVPGFIGNRIYERVKKFHVTEKEAASEAKKWHAQEAYTDGGETLVLKYEQDILVIYNDDIKEGTKDKVLKELGVEV